MFSRISENHSNTHTHKLKHQVHCASTHNDCTGNQEEQCGHGTCVDIPRTSHDEAHYTCNCEDGWTNPNGEIECSLEIMCDRVSTLHNKSIPAYECSARSVFAESLTCESITCQEDYELAQTANFTCNIDGSWTGFNECVPKPTLAENVAEFLSSDQGMIVMIIFLIVLCFCVYYFLCKGTRKRSRKASDGDILRNAVRRAMTEFDGGTPRGSIQMTLFGGEDDDPLSDGPRRRRDDEEDQEIFKDLGSPPTVEDSDDGGGLRMFRSELSRPKGDSRKRRKSSNLRQKEDGIMLDTHTGAEGRLSMKGQGDESPSSSFASIVNMHIPLPSQVDEDEEEEEKMKKMKKKKKKRRKSRRQSKEVQHRKYSSLDEEDDPEGLLDL